MKKIFIIVSLAATLAVAPLMALGLVAVYLLAAAPVIFGVVFVSGTTLFVTKSFIAALVTFAILTLIAKLIAFKESKECDMETLAKVVSEYKGV